MFLKLIERRKLRLLGDTNGALALNVGMATHRHNVSARPADIATQKEQVRDHLDVLRGHQLLGDAHPENAEASLALRVSGGSLLDLVAAQPGALFDSFPARVAAIVREVLEAVRMLFDERHIENALAALGLGLVVERNDRLAQAGQHRDVASRFDETVLRRDLRLRQRQHLDGVLWVREPFQPALAHRIEHDELRPALPCMLKLMQDARRVRAGVLADVNDEIAMLEPRKSS